MTIGGCSIHPSTEDEPGPALPTDLIVKKIRCEARTAIKDNLIQGLEKSSDPVVQDIVARLRTENPPSPILRDELFNGPIKNIIAKFADAGIAYDFVFDITEQNNIDPIIDIIGIFHRGSTPTNIGGMFDRKRQNTRNFTITDNFRALFFDTPANFCVGPVYDVHYIYPITGNEGIGKTINQFVNLTLFEHLAGPRDKPSGTAPTIVDKLVFTTTMSLATRRR